MATHGIGQTSSANTVPEQGRKESPYLRDICPTGYKSASPQQPNFDTLGCMNEVSLQDLQRDPASLLDRVEAGEHLVIAREGRPVAELRPLAPAVRGRRPYGLAAGSFTVPANFDAPLPDDILRDFEGR